MMDRKKTVKILLMGSLLMALLAVIIFILVPFSLCFKTTNESSSTSIDELINRVNAVSDFVEVKSEWMKSHKNSLTDIQIGYFYGMTDTVRVLAGKKPIFFDDISK